MHLNSCQGSYDLDQNIFRNLVINAFDKISYIIMKMKHLILIAVSVILLAACHKKNEIGINLTQRPISEWYTVLKDSSMNSADVFSEKNDAILARGDFGYIRTTEIYFNYELSVEWRWMNEATNSGIFLNIYEDKIWPSCYEIQLLADHAGDIINSGEASSNEYEANLADTTIHSPRIIEKMNPSNEKPVGEWNNAEIIVKNDTITVWINGELQNRITGITSKSGFIGLQSEGKDIVFRNVIVKPM